jgi:DNA polymerase-3 subunit beta
MKLTVAAGEVAAALVLAASLSDRPQVIEALKAVRIVANDDTVTISANVLDHAVTLTLPASVEVAGEAAVSAERLAGVTAALPAKAVVEIVRDEIAPVVHVRCGRSRFKFAIMPLDWLPPVPKLAEEIGRVDLAREEVLALLRPAFAAAKGQACFHMAGLLVHDKDSNLISVSTDGRRLVSVAIPSAAGLSSDHRLNVPASAIKIVNKILADKNIERVTLRRSNALFEISTAKMSFVSKLIDAPFPDYTRVIPAPSNNSVIVDRDELLLALTRASVAVEGKSIESVIGLGWKPDEPTLQLFYGDIVDDAVAAETAGTGTTGMQTALLTEIVEKALTGKRVKLDTLNGQGAMLITDPDDTGLLALQMPCRAVGVAAGNMNEKEEGKAA